MRSSHSISTALSRVCPVRARVQPDREPLTVGRIFRELKYGRSRLRLGCDASHLIQAQKDEADVECRPFISVEERVISRDRIAPNNTSWPGFRTYRESYSSRIYFPNGCLQRTM